MKDNKLSTFADRLKAKLSGSNTNIDPDVDVIDLVDEHLEFVSGGNHTSGHSSHTNIFR